MAIQKHALPTIRTHKTAPRHSAKRHST